MTDRVVKEKIDEKDDTNRDEKQENRERMVIKEICC